MLRIERKFRGFLRARAASCWLVCVAVLAGAVWAESSIPQNKIWPRPNIVAPPASVEKVKQPVVLLDGKWKINVDPSGEFWSNSVDPASWSAISVPGQADMQGIAIPRNHPYAYKTRIKIPVDFTGKRIFLRFDGVTGTAKVWVNGVEAGQHYEGFTVWDCDITDKVEAGKDAWLTAAAVKFRRRAGGTEGFFAGTKRNSRTAKSLRSAVSQLHFPRFVDLSPFS